MHATPKATVANFNSSGGDVIIVAESQPGGTLTVNAERYLQVAVMKEHGISIVLYLCLYALGDPQPSGTFKFLNMPQQKVP